ncbi:hypothetical protein LguiA_013682 [Lonicera macranthoides]
MKDQPTAPCELARKIVTTMCSMINLAKSSAASLPSSFKVLFNAEAIASFFIIFISLKCLSINFDSVALTIVFG